MTSKPDMLEDAWALIANAWAFVEREDGQTSLDWLAAAERWRDNYHPLNLTAEEPDDG